jgi:hypothetical protein
MDGWMDRQTDRQTERTDGRLDECNASRISLITIYVCPFFFGM